jgi:hypothetical protein
MKSSDLAGAALLLASLLGGCAASHDIDGPSGSGSTESFPSNLTAACLAEIRSSNNNGLPEHLECTGLYTDMASKKTVDDVLEFQPANLLWSDNAGKKRWIYLPPDSKINAASPNAWVFPEGTHVWKEFRRADDSIIETRIFKKTEDGWAKATYEWDNAQHEATIVPSTGKDVMVDGHEYRIPSLEECDDCHGGRRDRLMGFEQVSLGMPAATGVTLKQLVDDDRLENFSGPTSYQIGSDPDSAEAKALGWLHINCGVSCHNDNDNSNGHSTNMRLILDPKLLDGRDVSSEFAPVKTTVGQDVSTLRWVGSKRIVSGSPDDSWLVTLISRRQAKEQMPPVGTYVVDDDHVSAVREWIEGLPKP